MTLALCKPCADKFGPVMMKIERALNSREFEVAIAEFRKLDLCAECNKRAEMIRAAQ